MRPDEIRIRDASLGDAGSIASVLRAAFREFEPLYTPGGFRATTPDDGEVRRRFTEGPTWVAERGRAVVGTVAAVLRDDELYIRSMAVLPEARGRGVASLLLATVEGYAAARRCRRLVLSTTPFLAAAISLYERAGFRASAERPRDLFGTPLITMVKEFGPNAPAASVQLPGSS